MYYLVRKMLVQLIVGNEKAIVAFIVGFVGTLATKHGLNLDATKMVYLQAGLMGLIAHLVVYLTPNTKA